MPIFLRSEWLFCLIPLVIVMCWIYYRQTKAHNWGNVCDEKLLPLQLISIGNSSLIPLVILGISWFIAIIALAGPSWTRVKSPVFKSNATTIILLDLSPEMLVQDPSPNRLARAKYKISDLLKTTSDRRYGLSVFSGEAFTVSPVTSDSGTIESMVAILEPTLMPIGGRNISSALEHARNLLIQSGQPKGNILLITTGDADYSSITTARNLNKKGITISVLGIGSKIGGPIPAEKGFLKDEKDRVILSKLDANSLEKIASAGGGLYKTLTHDQMDLESLTTHWFEDAKRVQDQMSMDRNRDDGYWFLWLLIPFISLAFRPGWRDSIL